MEEEVDCPIGQRYGFIVVIGEAPTPMDGKPRWIVLCDCGKTSVKRAVNIRYGGTRSCGCAQGGGPLSRLPGRVGNDATRFEAMVKKHSDDPGCWEWLGAKSHDGYGIFMKSDPCNPRGFTKGPAHRWSFEQAKGPVPEGLEMDHLCARIQGGIGRACVNPNHLEPVTQRENSLRSNSVGGTNARKASCINGHEFSAENTAPVQLNDGRIGRRCRECSRQNLRAWRKKQKERNQ